MWVKSGNGVGPIDWCFDCLKMIDCYIMCCCKLFFICKERICTWWILFQKRVMRMHTKFDINVFIVIFITFSNTRYLFIYCVLLCIGFVPHQQMPRFRGRGGRGVPCNEETKPYFYTPAFLEGGARGRVWF
jgi:hypothetical protein